MSDSGSDIEMKTAPAMKMSSKTVPTSPLDDLKTSKKITTKSMITNALTELKSRKGVSLYAIKKYLTENYNVDTEKGNYLIKKSIKSGVEDGTFIQIKGIGASGSFKLANTKTKPKPKKKKEQKPEKTKKTELDGNKTEIDKKDAKKNKTMTKTKTTEEEKPAKPKKMEIKKDKKETEKRTGKKVETKVRSKKAVSENEDKKPKVKSSQSKTPTKKRAAMMKRKSIGSIIKPPKMKPRSAT